MTEKTEAQRLAKCLDDWAEGETYPSRVGIKNAAAELRRLEEILALRHAAGIRYAAQINQLEAVNAQLLEALELVMADVKTAPNAYEAQRQAIAAAKGEA